MNIMIDADNMLRNVTGQKQNSMKKNTKAIKRVINARRKVIENITYNIFCV